MKRFLIISVILFISFSIYGNVSYDRVVRSKTELCNKPKECNNAKEIAAGTHVTIIDTTEKYGCIFGKKSPWVKIRTQNGDTGFLLLGEIPTLKGYMSEKKSIKEAQNKPLPDLYENFNIFVFGKLLGYNGPNPINKLLDVLVVDKRLFKNVTAVSLKDCKKIGTNEIGSIIGVYSVENQYKKKNDEFIPEKAWLVNKKTGKIEDFSSSQCRCSPEPAGW